MFESVLNDVPQGPRPWLHLAQACRLVGDAAAETRALSSLLDAEPRNLTALLLMGERKRDDGDDRAALSFFTTALAQAAAGPAPPHALQPLLSRAAAFREGAASRFAEHLEDAVGESSSARVRHSLDLTLGRRELFLQQPSMFYFEGLPQRPFYDRSEFDWVPALEAATPAIRDELASVLNDDEAFRPYVEDTPGRPRPNNPLFGDPAWSAFYLWRSGEPVAANAARCPATMAALEALPIPRIAGRSPIALFSRLTPGTHIQPHHGLLNTRLICHLPLVVPEGCGLRVGADTRSWREGELTIFDDSYEHEAWNRGASTRTVLLFEIWRPEIEEAERVELGRLFEAIDRYGPPAVDYG